VVSAGFEFRDDQVKTLRDFVCSATCLKVGMHDATPGKVVISFPAGVAMDWPLSSTETARCGLRSSVQMKVSQRRPKRAFTRGAFAEGMPQLTRMIGSGARVLHCRGARASGSFLVPISPPSGATANAEATCCVGRQMPASAEH
jgi:hypothetical protein